MPKTTIDTLPASERAEASRITRGRRPHLYVAFEADRAADPAAAPSRHRLDDVDVVVLGRGAKRSWERAKIDGQRVLTLTLPDPRMSGVHAKLFFLGNRWNLHDEGSRNGTVLNGALATSSALADGDLIEAGHTIFLFQIDDAPDEEEADVVAATDAAAGLSTLHPLLYGELALVPNLARSTVSTVVQGESGTGKELVARAIHELSERSGAFVPVNCGAIPDTLVETELFGYRKGAFSGASEDRAGLVRAADRGTLFLDEIGDLALPSQAALLRVLQEREVVPVGATRAVPVDLRVVAATHRDLEDLVAKEQFRGDLLARLSGYTLVLPPLRERRCDIGILVGVLLRRIAPGAKPTFSQPAARALFRHDWPRNVRELEKALERAFVLSKGETIDVAHLPDFTTKTRSEPPRETTADDGGDARRAELLQMLRDHGGNVSAVARAMGKGRTQIQRWIKRYGIDTSRFGRG